jgi:peptide/nickel transport system permease protein
MLCNRDIGIVAAFVFGLALVGLGAPVLPLQDPLSTNMVERLAGPSWNHVFGTDELGRDLLSRTVHGFSTTVLISIGALLSSLALGIALGAVAGYATNRLADRVFIWIVNLLMSLPFLLVMAAILSLTRPTIGKAYAILAGIMWVYPARIVRAEVMRTKTLPYVEASRALGSPEWRIIAKTILPACTGAALTFSLSYLPEIVGLEAGLSFLGLGVQPPDPGLGKMIFDGLSYISSAWWLPLFPAAVLFLVVLGVNLFLMSWRTAHV